MRYMLDTNICIYVIKHKPEAVIKRFFMHDPRELCISSITYAELMYGVEKSQKKDVSEYIVCAAASGFDCHWVEYMKTFMLI